MKNRIEDNMDPEGNRQPIHREVETALISIKGDADTRLTLQIIGIVLYHTFGAKYANLEFGELEDFQVPNIFTRALLDEKVDISGGTGLSHGSDQLPHFAGSLIATGNETTLELRVERLAAGMWTVTLRSDNQKVLNNIIAINPGWKTDRVLE